VLIDLQHLYVIDGESDANGGQDEQSANPRLCCDCSDKESRIWLDWGQSKLWWRGEGTTGCEMTTLCDAGLINAVNSVHPTSSLFRRFLSIQASGGQQTFEDRG
jgi:hypothetical protein